MDVLSQWQGFYNDPWFWQFPMATLAISMAAFLTVAIPWTVIAWRDPIALRKYKIQSKPFEMKKFLLPSIGRIVVNNIILASVLVLVWPMLKLTGVHNGAHIYVVYLWVILRQIEGADGHIGYDIPWNPAHLFPVYEGPVYHDFHHAKFKGNYAGFLPYLDKYLGRTHIPAYLNYLKQKKKGLKPVEIEGSAKEAKRQAKLLKRQARSG